MKVNQAFTQTSKEFIALKAKRREELGRILALLAPGKSLTHQARALKTSRQCIHSWLSGRTWPNKVMAARISKLTGIPIEEIRPD